MGCDIHTMCEHKVDDKWTAIPIDPEAFDWRSYGLFGFLADVRNYSFVPPITPQRGVPGDASEEAKDYIVDGAYHSCSWLSVQELLAFDYDATFEDRRTRAQIAPNVWSCAEDAGEGRGKVTTFRDFLGAGYFKELDRLKAAGVERIVFGFDS